MISNDKIETLNWDSAFFGYPVVKINLEKLVGTIDFNDLITAIPAKTKLAYIFLAIQQIIN